MRLSASTPKYIHAFRNRGIAWYYSVVATHFLKDSARNLNDTWPYPVVQFLRGEIDEPQLLTLADNDDKRTEARCYVGLDLAIKGRTSELRAHFRAGSRNTAMRLSSNMALPRLS